MARVLDMLVDRLDGGLASERDSYLYQFTTFHEDVLTKRLPGRDRRCPAPSFALDGPRAGRVAGSGSLDGDAVIPGGEFRLGSKPEDACL